MHRLCTWLGLKRERKRRMLVSEPFRWAPYLGNGRFRWTPYLNMSTTKPSGQGYPQMPIDEAIEARWAGQPKDDPTLLGRLSWASWRRSGVPKHVLATSNASVWISP